MFKNVYQFRIHSIRFAFIVSVFVLESASDLSSLFRYQRVRRCPSFGHMCSIYMCGSVELVGIL